MKPRYRTPILCPIDSIYGFSNNTCGELNLVSETISYHGTPVDFTQTQARPLSEEKKNMTFIYVLFHAKLT